MYAVDTNRVMIKVRCPEDRLTDVAEVLRLEMKTVDGKRDLLSDQCAIYCLNDFLIHYLLPNLYRWLCSFPGGYSGNVRPPW